MESLDTPAVVVRVVNYGEADRILTLLTHKRGKISAIARGARRSHRRFGAALGLFSVGRAFLKERRNAELWWLESWEAGASVPTALSVDLAKVAHASYVCEIARELCAPAHPDPMVFDLVCETLAVLASDRPACVQTLRAFEVQVLDALGLGPVLDRCTSCGTEEIGSGSHRFDIRHGGLVCSHCQSAALEFPEAARRVLLRARQISIEAAASALPIDETTNRAAREAMLGSIENHLGKRLRSVSFLTHMLPGGPKRHDPVAEPMEGSER